MAIIREVKAYPIEVPKKPWANAKGATKVQPAVIAELLTEDGVSGFGEINTSYGIPRETTKEILTAIHDVFAPALRGASLDMLGILRAMDRLLHGHQQAKDAVQNAALDALSRTLGVPLHVLLGGKARDSIPLAGPLGIASLEESVQDAERYVGEQGFRALKIKIGKDPRKDVARVKAIRAAVGDEVVMRVDINESYDLSTALRVVADLEEVRLQSIEQPVAARDLHGLARVTASTATLIMADESVQSSFEAMYLARRQAVTAFHVKGAGRGGLLGAKAIADIGAAASIHSICGRISTLTLGAASELHLVAATPSILLPGEMAGHLFAHDDITTERMTLVDGAVPVPTGPGLGFEVDRAKLDRYRIDR